MTTFDDWRTPQALFDQLDAEFHFTLDAAATADSAKCLTYFTREDDGLSLSWEGETVFCNPPAENKAEWIKKCHNEGQKPGTTVVLLTVAKTETGFFHDYIYGKCELRFLRGRVYLEDADGKRQGTPPAGSLVAIYRGAISNAGSKKELVWGLLSGSEMTANEIAKALKAAGHDIDCSAVSKRINKLKAAGLIAPTGRRLCKATGKNAMAYAAVAGGGAGDPVSE